MQQAVNIPWGMAAPRYSEDEPKASPGVGWDNMQEFYELHMWPFQTLFYTNCEENPQRTHVYEAAILQYFIVNALNTMLPKHTATAARDGWPGHWVFRVTWALGTPSALNDRCNACCHRVADRLPGLPLSLSICSPGCIGSWESL